MAKRNALSFFVGALCGAVTGAVAGLLLAPNSGKETRGKLNNRLQDLKESGQQGLDTAKQKTETMIAKTLDAIDHGFEKLGRIVDERNIPTDAKEAREPREPRSSKAQS